MKYEVNVKNESVTLYFDLFGMGESTIVLSNPQRPLTLSPTTEVGGMIRGHVSMLMDERLVEFCEVRCEGVGAPTQAELHNTVYWLIEGTEFRLSV